MHPGDPSNTPKPPTPRKKRAFARSRSNEIVVPELERKKAEEEARRIAEQQKLNPQAPDANGLNASGLPSSEAYYQKKVAPVHTSAITPIVESRIWIKIIAITTVFAGLFWIKEAVDGLRFQPGFIPGLIHFVQLVLSYFFFILPAYKLWILTREIDQFLIERDETTMGSVLFAHARLWKYGGAAASGAILFIVGSIILKKVSGLLTI